MQRLADRTRGHGDLHPADAAVHLPAERHAHGLRRLAALARTRGSLVEAACSVAGASGQRLGNRQVEQLAQRAAVDFDEFDASRSQPLCEAGPVGCCHATAGRGAATGGAAAGDRQGRHQPQAGHPSVQGEQRHRKRLAELGGVDDCAPVPARQLPSCPPPTSPAAGADRAGHLAGRQRQPGRRAGDRPGVRPGDPSRPDQHRTWVVLVDGNHHQRQRVHAKARARGVNLTIVVDFVHLLQYLWRAAWCFFAEATRRPDVGAHPRAADPAGHSSDVAGAIRRKATWAGRADAQRRNADACASYPTNKRPYLDHPTALAQGWPIATGTIEGAYRHLIKDRMDHTGARWGLAGAEAVLKLRALRSNGDFHAYWASISPASGSECTRHATPTRSSPPDDRPSEALHPYGCQVVVVFSFWTWAGDASRSLNNRRAR